MIELAGERTATSRTFLEPDGSFRTSVYGQPVNYRDSAGRWRAIDSSLVQAGRGGYAWESKANGFRASFKGSADADLLRFDAGDGAAFALSLDGATSVGAVKGFDSGLVYADVLPQTDLGYAVIGSGVKESLVLKGAGAPSSFRFLLRPTGSAGLRAVAQADGSVAFYADGGGEPAFTIAAPIVSDSRPGAQSLAAPGSLGAPPGSTPATGGLPPSLPAGPAGLAAPAVGKASLGVQQLEDGSFAVTLRVDPDWLGSPARVFPVVVDPTIETPPDVQDGYWNTAVPASTPNMSASELLGGYDGTGANYASALKFDLAVIPPGARVTGAKVNVFATRCIPASTDQYASYGCPYWWPGQGSYSSTMELYQLTSSWGSSTQWQNLSVDSTSLGSFGGQYYQSTGTRIPNWFTLTNAALTQKVQAIANGSVVNNGFLLKKTAGDASGLAFAGSRYADVSSLPRLDVEWVADGVQLANPLHVHSNGAELSWQHYSGGLGPYATAVLNNTPAAYWRLDDAAGSPFTVADWSGNNLSAGVNGGVTLQQPGATYDGDQSASFDGSSAHVSNGDVALNSITDTFTIEAWVKRANTTSGLYTIFSRGESNGGGFRLQLTANNKLELGGGTCDGCYNGGFKQIMLSTSSIADTGWHYVAATKSGASVHLYIDGTDVSGTLDNETLTCGWARVEIGANVYADYDHGGGAAYNAYWNGSIDEAAVYDHVLSAAQIAAHYNAFNDLIAGFDRYEVHRSTSSGFTPSSSTLIATIRDPSIQGYRDTTAKPSTSFYYKVVTVTSGGSYNSNQASATTPADGLAQLTVQPGLAGGSAQATSITSSSPCANLGASSTLTLDPSTRSLLRFDLRAVRSNATVTAASLSLFTFSSAPATVNVSRVTSDWSEGTGTGSCNATGASWQSRQPNVAWATAGGDYDSSGSLSVAVPGGNPHWDSWNVQSIVQGWLNGSSANLGFLLKHATEAGAPAIAYTSNDYPTSLALRPKLTLTYQDDSHALGPQVAIGNPAPAQQVNGTVTVTAGASDDGRVASVQFKLDGANLGAAVTAPPYQTSWNTTSLGYGTSHTLTAVATDDAGNQTTSSQVSVTVANSNAPTTAVTSASAQTGASYSATVSADSPVAWWRLGEPNGSTTFASNVGTFPGTWNASPTLGAPGAIGGDTNTAATLTYGLTQYGTVANASQLDIANNFSLELWVKRTRDKQTQAIVGKPLTTSTVSENYALWFDGSNKVRFEVGSGAPLNKSAKLTSAAALDTNWHYVVATFASGQMKLYVDGVLSASMTANGFTAAGTNASTLDVGHAGTSSYYGGSLDEIALYAGTTAPLSATQVQSHYQAASPVPSANWTVSASASDDQAVSKVEFYVDGDRFATDTTSPYTATLSTLSFPTYDGSHTLTTRAYDADGNVTTSAGFPITVANATGANAKYKASLTTSSTIPAVVYYDPSLGTQAATPVTVQVTNTSALTLSSTTTKLRYQWIAADGTASTPTDTALSANVAPGGSTSVTVSVPPPTPPTGVYRGRYRLRFDLYDTSAAVTFSSKGNKPLDSWVTVARVASDELGLERYQQYDGEDLGGNLKDAVNLANGNNVVKWVPFNEPGIGLNTAVTLTYNSLEIGSVSPLGNGWSLAISGVTAHGLPLDIHPNAADTAAGRTAKWVAFTDADGTYHRFTGNSSGSYYTAPPGVHLYLKQDTAATADKRWQLVKPDRTIYFFDAQGYPTRVQDKDGNALTFTLQDPVPAGEDAYGLAKRVTSVTDQGGRAFTLAYYSKAETATPSLRGKLKSITDHVGHRLRFDYYDDGNLLRITEEGGTNADGSYLPDRAAIFTYVNSAGTDPAIGTLAARKNPDPATVQGPKLYSVIDFRGNETSFTYYTAGNSQGRLSGRTDRANNQTTFLYDTVARTATVTKPLNASEHATWVYSFDTSGRVSLIQDPVNPANTQVLWTSDNMVQKVTEPTGQFSLYAYNNNGYLTSKTDQLGHQTTLTYQDIAVDGNDTSATWETGRTAGHISRITSVTKPVGNATPANPTDYKWTFAYDPARDSQDQLKTVTDPLGNATTNSWNTNGTLDSTTLPANGDGITRTTTYNNYDSNGLSTQVTDAAGGIARAGYLANGNLAWQQDPNHGSYSGGTPASYQSQFFYDSFGRLGRSSRPKSTQYRAGLLIWNDTAYDANDNVTSSLNSHYGIGDSGAAPQTSSAYDVMDRPTMVTGPRAAADGGPVQTQSVYDAGGRVISVTNPNGVTTAPSGSAWTKDFTTETSYDKLDRAASTSSYAVDASGNVDPSQTRTVNYCYDLAGDLRTVTGPKGAASFAGCPAITTATYTPYVGAYTNRFNYDAAHRQTTTTNPLGFSTQTAYNENGAVVLSTDENGKQTTVSYNDRGEKIKQVEPFDTGRMLTTEWEYDNLGNLKRLISPRAYDAGGGGPTFTDYVESYSYDGLNRLVETTLPTDASTPHAYLHNAYDANGNQTMVSLPTANSDPASLTAANKTITSYWDTSAIYSSTDPANPVVRYDHTAEGWQTSRIPESASPGTLDLSRAMYWDYLPDGLTRALLDIGGERVLYNYDADGNQTAATHANGITTSAQAPLTVQGSFDGFDETVKVRTQKPGVSGTWLATRYSYDLNGNQTQMVDNAEEDAAGNQTAEGRVFTYNYNSADEVTSQADNFATSGTSADDEQYAFTWTTTGNLDTRTVSKANGTGWTQEQKSVHSYYDNGQLRTLTNYDGNNSPIEDHTLAYISGGAYTNGNRVSDTFKLKNADGGSTCFPTTCTATWTYDARDRLTQETDGTGNTTTYTLDTIGNAVGEQTTGQPVITRTFIGQQLSTVSQAGGTSKYLYDSYGNLDCITDSSWQGSTCPTAGSTALQTDYIYDYTNRLAGQRAYSGGTLTDSADYVNDPLNRPVSEMETHSGSTTTTQLSYIGASDAVSKEVLTGATSSTKKYAYDALGQRATITEGTNRYSYLFDPHGSVAMLVDQNNTVEASYGYNAYGGANPVLTKTAAGFNATANPYRWTGKRYDTGSKTLDMGARRYSATTGRFLQQDGYAHALVDVGLALDPFTANRYAFAGGNPINFVETDGHIVMPIMPDDCWYGPPGVCSGPSTPTPKPSPEPPTGELPTKPPATEPIVDGSSAYHPAIEDDVAGEDFGVPLAFDALSRGACGTREIRGPGKTTYHGWMRWCWSQGVITSLIGHIHNGHIKGYHLGGHDRETGGGVGYPSWYVKRTGMWIIDITQDIPGYSNFIFQWIKVTLYAGGNSVVDADFTSG